MAPLRVRPTRTISRYQAVLAEWRLKSTRPDGREWHFQCRTFGRSVTSPGAANLKPSSALRQCQLVAFLATSAWQRFLATDGAVSLHLGYKKVRHFGNDLANQAVTGKLEFGKSCSGWDYAGQGSVICELWTAIFE